MSADKKQPQKRGNAAEANGQPSFTPATEASVPAVAPIIKEFEGHSLTVLWRDSKPWWIAKEVGAAIGYEDGSKLVDLIGDEWSDEFIEGTDFTRVTGVAAAEILRAVETNDRSENAELTNPRNSGNGRGARRVLLLSETGINLAAIKTRKPAGKRLRRWLASEVLPSIARGNTLSAATTEQVRVAVRAEMALQFRTAESKRTELMRLTDEATRLLVRAGSDPDRARGKVIELAKGRVCYGGTGRELGYMSMKQFKDARATLEGIIGLFSLFRLKKQRRQLAATVTSDSQQMTLPMFEAKADVGSAVVTVTVTPKKKEAA